MNEAKLLIIAGSDSCGGAGIQADIKTATALKVYSATVITSLTAQNTRKVFAIHDLPIDFLKQQLEVVLEDMQFDAIKIGMLSNSDVINVVSQILKNKYKKIPIVLDPVMVATSGDVLLQKTSIEFLKKNLINKAKIITPNIDEAEILSGIKIKNLSDMREASTIIKNFGCQAVLIKGGHLNFTDGKVHSLLLDDEDDFYLVSNKKVGNKDIHGTGCTLASAIASNLAKKLDLINAVRKANDYVYRCVSSNIKAGKGSLVLKHW
jgi:hydroxymethylpyrimidine/phosphomethylpyrimidine kinase